MELSTGHTENIMVRLARSPAEIEAAQHLRYKVFYEEFHAVPSPEMLATKRDFDKYDEVADHLIVFDESIDDPSRQIIGTYRLLRKENAARIGSFYTAGEFDISPLTNSPSSLLELGRSCVLPQYRTRPVMQLLWQGITDYMLDHSIGLMFGCASLYGTDVNGLSLPLSYLYHFHLAPPELRPRALEGRYVEMNRMAKDDIDQKTAFMMLPPLIKGYLRLGAFIGNGAVVDEQFDTTDVCIILPMSKVAERYRKHYSRKVNREIPSYEDDTILTAGE